MQQQQRYQDLLGPRHHRPLYPKSQIFVQKFSLDKILAKKHICTLAAKSGDTFLPKKLN